MKNLILTSLFLLGVTLGFSSFAGEHNPASIIGKEISLFERDHAFAGEILKTPVFGVFNHDPYGAHVSIRKGEKTLELVFNFNKETGAYTASIHEERLQESGEKTLIKTDIRFLSVKVLEGNQALITLEIDGVQTEISLQAQSFEGNHFKNSIFSTTYLGQKMEFAFSGESCPGYSSNIAMMILGTYAHLLK